MRFYFILTLTLVCFSAESFGQKAVSGTIVNESGKGIAFVRIGIVGTSIGLISDDSGFFSLSIPQRFYEKGLTFQVPGYNTRTLKISDLIRGERLIVPMTVFSQDLGEILVISKQPKSKVIGNTAKRKTSEAYDYIDYPGNMAYVTKVDSNKKPYQLEEISVYVGNKYPEPFYIRPMLFTVDPDSGEPAEAIITQNLIFKVEEGEHWIAMEVSGMNIVVDQPVYVGVEWLSSTGTHEYFKIHANFRKGKSYMRTQISEALSSESKSTWNEYNRRPMIRATISY